MPTRSTLQRMETLFRNRGIPASIIFTILRCAERTTRLEVAGCQTNNLFLLSVNFHSSKITTATATPAATRDSHLTLNSIHSGEGQKTREPISQSILIIKAMQELTPGE